MLNLAITEVGSKHIHCKVILLQSTVSHDATIFSGKYGHNKF